MTRWSSHSEVMLQASLDDVDWDMFRASSADVSEFTDVALSFVYMLTAARLCRSARQEAADRAAMLIMLSPCRKTRFGEN